MIFQSTFGALDFEHLHQPATPFNIEEGAPKRRLGASRNMKEIPVKQGDLEGSRFYKNKNFTES